MHLSATNIHTHHVNWTIFRLHNKNHLSAWLRTSVNILTSCFQWQERLDEFWKPWGDGSKKIVFNIFPPFLRYFSNDACCFVTFLKCMLYDLNLNRKPMEVGLLLAQWVITYAFKFFRFISDYLFCGASYFYGHRLLVF